MDRVDHAQVPIDANDGDTWTCPDCGIAYEFVVLDDGLPGEWVYLEERP